MKFKTFIEDFANVAKKYIEKYEECKDLTGEEKKARLDDIVKNYVLVAIDNIPLNFIVKIVIKRVIVENIPFITQAIYNLLKARIKGITQ